MTNHNVGELLEGQLNDFEIRSVINYLEKKRLCWEIPRCYKKHLSKLTIVNGLLCSSHHRNISLVTPKLLR